MADDCERDMVVLAVGGQPPDAEQLWLILAMNADRRLDLFAGVATPGRETEQFHTWHLPQTAANGTWSSWAMLTDYPDPFKPYLLSSIGRNQDLRLEAFAIEAETGTAWQTFQTTPNGGWHAGSPAVSRPSGSFRGQQSWPPTRTAGWNCSPPASSTRTISTCGMSGRPHPTMAGRHGAASEPPVADSVGATRPLRSDPHPTALCTCSPLRPTGSCGTAGRPSQNGWSGWTNRGRPKGAHNSGCPPSTQANPAVIHHVFDGADSIFVAALQGPLIACQVQAPRVDTGFGDDSVLG